MYVYCELEDDVNKDRNALQYTLINIKNRCV